MDRGAWWAAAPGMAKTEHFTSLQLPSHLFHPANPRDHWTTPPPGQRLYLVSQPFLPCSILFQVCLLGNVQ